MTARLAARLFATAAYRYRAADNGSLVIALLENTNESTFKKLYIEDGQYYLKPLNPSWQPQLIELKDPTKICGVVFEKQVDF